jgi:hypothetical protein
MTPNLLITSQFTIKKKKHEYTLRHCLVYGMTILLKKEIIITRNEKMWNRIVITIPIEVAIPRNDVQPTKKIVIS